MVKFFFRIKKEYLVIGLISIFYILNNFFWLSQNTYPSGPDEFIHLSLSLDFFKSFFLGINNIFQTFRPDMSGHWPPFYHITSALFDLFFGYSYISSVMVNNIYFIILIVAVYYIGKKLFSENAGILAVILISLYPMVYRYSRVFNPDFALLAMTALSTSLLLYTDNFKNLRNSILFGICFGLGMLTKWTFILFLLGPLACTLFSIFVLKFKEKKHCKRQFLTLLFSLTIAIIIPIFWYLSSFSILFERAKSFLWSAAYYHPKIDPAVTSRSLFQIDKFFEYFRFLINEEISFLFFVIFLFALVFYFLKSKHKLFLSLWYIIPFFILSISFQKEGRFMLPSLIAVALITAAGLESMPFNRNNFFKKIDLYLLIILLGILQFFDISYNFQRKDKAFTFFSPIGDLSLFYSPVTEQHEWSFGPPLKKDWKMDKIADAIADSRRHPYNYSPLIIGVVCDDAYARKVFNYPMCISYYFARQNINLKPLVLNFIDEPRQDSLFFLSRLNEINCIIYVSGNKFWPIFDDLDEPFNKLFLEIKSYFFYTKNMHIYSIDKNNIIKEETEKKLKELLMHREKFSLLKSLELPEGYSAHIYLKNDKPLLQLLQ